MQSVSLPSRPATVVSSSIWRVYGELYDDNDLYDENYQVKGEEMMQAKTSEMIIIKLYSGKDGD